MHRKIANKIIVATLAGGICISCVGVSRVNAQEKELSIMIGQDHYTPGLQAMLEKAQEEEGYLLDIQVVDNTQYLNLIQMKKASGEMPDMFVYNVPDVYGVFDPVTDLYDLSNENWIQNMVNPEGFRYEDGKLYAFPFKSSSGYHSMIYNKDVFDRYDLSVPETVDEFYNVCDTLKENGVIPILIASDIWAPQIWFDSGFSRAMGSEEAIDEMTQAVIDGEKTFNDYPQLAETIDYVLGLKEKGYINDDVATLTWDESWVEMADGEGAMLMGEGLMIGQRQSEFPDVNFGVFNLPLTTASQDILDGSCYSSCFCISADSKHTEEATDLLELLSTPDYLNLYFEDAAGFPAFNEVDGGYIQEDVQALYDKHYSNNSMITNINTKWETFRATFNDYLWSYYLEALVKGNMTGEEILDRWQADVDKYLKESVEKGK